jgi:hypothetical protein
MHLKFWLGIAKERDHLDKLDISRKITVKLNLKK